MMLLALVLVIGVCGGVGAAAEPQDTAVQIQKLQNDLFKLETEMRKNAAVQEMKIENSNDRLVEVKDWVTNRENVSTYWYYALMFCSGIMGIYMAGVAVWFTINNRQNRAELKAETKEAKESFEKEIKETLNEIKGNAEHQKETIEKDKKEFEEKLNKLFDEKKNEINILKEECQDLKEECGKLKDRCKFNADQSDEILEEHQEKVRNIKYDNKIEDMDDETKEAVEDVASSKSEEFFTSLKARALKHEMNEQWDKALRIWQTIEQEFPDHGETNFKIGNLYQQMYKQESDPKVKSEYFEKSSHHYREATIEDPKDTAAWNNWALLLADRAKQANGEEKLKLWNEAADKYKKATDINPKLSAAWYNWALLLADRAKQANGEEKLKLWNEAEDKYKKTTDISQDDFNTWNNWAVLLTEKAKQANEEDRLKLWDRAEDKFNKATDINPEDFKAWNNWALLLADRAKQANGEEKITLWNNAEDKYKKATDIKPELYGVWYNWAILLASKATVDPQNIDNNLLEQAKEKALRAEEILEGKGAYNLACIASLQSQFEDCKKWLLARKNSELGFPPCNHLRSDTDFDNIRNHPDYKDWFNDFVEQLCKEEQDKPDATDSE